MKPFCPACPTRRIISIQNTPMRAIGISQPSGVAPEVALDDAGDLHAVCCRGPCIRSGSSTRMVSKASRPLPPPSAFVGGCGGCRRSATAWRRAPRAASVRAPAGPAPRLPSCDPGSASCRSRSPRPCPAATAALKSLYEHPVGTQIGAQDLLKQQHGPQAQDEVAERKPELLLLAVHHSQTKTQIGCRSCGAAGCYQRWRGRHARRNRCRAEPDGGGHKTWHAS